MTDAGFWKERQAEFEKYAKQWPDLEARWDVANGTWWFWDASTPQGVVDQQSEGIFKALASKAATGLADDGVAVAIEGWQLWLDSMRRGQWGYHAYQNVACTELEWDAGVKNGKPLNQVRRELPFNSADKLYRRLKSGKLRRLSARELKGKWSDDLQQYYHWLENGIIEHLFETSARFCEDAEARRFKLEMQTQFPTEINGARNAGVPARSLQAISEDQERQVNAKRDLERALQTYFVTLSQERDIDYGKLVEIWGKYAIGLYDSFGESFQGIPITHEAAFGQNGVLSGEQTLEEVKKDLTNFRMPRPAHWPSPNTSPSTDHDDPEHGHNAAETDVSFVRLLDTPSWNRIRDRVLGRAHDWERSSTRQELISAISDLGKTLKRIPPDHPDYKVWEFFSYKVHEIEARWVSYSARRAKQGKPFDSKRAVRFVLSLFDNAVNTQIELVKDADSAAGCETEIRTLARGSLDYLENILTEAGQTDQLAELRHAIELKLVDRLAKAKLRAIEAAKPASGPAGTAPKSELTKPEVQPPLPAATDVKTAAKEFRAATVAKLINELNVLRHQMFEDSSEYDRLRAQYPDYLTFEVAAKRPDLKRKVLSIRASTRHIRLAQELAGAHHGRATSTIQDDWKRHKPPDFKRAH